jgi:RNA polymerase sigma-70 factor (ECF subfamily)
VLGWPTTDAALARWTRRAARGDAAAFASLYRVLHPLVLGYFARRLDTRAEAEDLASALFHRVLDALDRYDPARASVRGWVLAMARNAMIDHLRARRDSAPIEDVLEQLADASLRPDDAIAQDDDRRELRTLVAELPAQTREMLALRYVDGWRCREIAEQFAMSEAAVKQRFSRTIRELRARATEAARAKGAAGYAF